MWLSLTHPLQGTWPATQACTLTGNRAGDPLVHRPALNPLSYTSRDLPKLLKDHIFGHFLLSFIPPLNIEDHPVCTELYTVYWRHNNEEEMGPVFRAIVMEERKYKNSTS